MVDVPLLCYESVKRKLQTTDTCWSLSQLHPKLATWKTMCGTWWLKKNGALRVHVLENPHVEPSNAALNLGRTDWIDAGHPGVRSSYTMWANHLWMGCSYTVCGLRNAVFFQIHGIFWSLNRNNNNSIIAKETIQNMEIWRKQMYRNKRMFLLVSFLTINMFLIICSF